MKKAIEIANEYFNSISGHQLSDRDDFLAKIVFFDNLDYLNINLYYALSPYRDEYKNIKDITPDDDKKTKIISCFLGLVLTYLQEKTDYKDRQKIDSIIKKATRKANDVLMDAIYKLKQLKENDEYFKLKDKDIRALTSQVTILPDNPINEKLPKPNKQNIQSFLNRFKNNSQEASVRSAKSLVDSIS